MNHLKHTFILAALCLIPLTTTAEQVINSSIPNEWPDARYIVHGDGTVTDTQTGLLWKQCSEGQVHEQTIDSDTCTGEPTTYTWKQALEHAANHTFAGRSDWRVPNIKELASLVATDRYKPAINLTVFPNTPASWHWSASPSADISSFAWQLYFASGLDDDYGRDTTYRVRLVASGQ